MEAVLKEIYKFEETEVCSKCCYAESAAFDRYVFHPHFRLPERFGGDSLGFEIICPESELATTAVYVCIKEV